MGNKKTFSAETVERIRRQLDKYSVKEICEREHLPEGTIRYIIKERIGVSLRAIGNKSRSWSNEELAILRDPSLTDYEKVQKLPERTSASVRQARRRHNFQSKPVEFTRKFENNGYTHVRKNGKYVRRNRLVAEQAIGRKLGEDEVVHHINGRKTDDRPENLFVCDRATHTRLHYSTMEIIATLMEKGVVTFDREKGEYILCKNI